MAESKDNASHYGKLYYDTGELKYEGHYETNQDGCHSWPKGKGTAYFKTGAVYREGEFQRGGLLNGKEYYPSGKLKFEGKYNCREKDGGYYGPTYPSHGKFYSEDGTLIYDGDFKIEKRGSMGYPMVVKPEGFGHLE